ncbi:dienelactone hydrolase family protein [Rhodococcus sp. NPDC059234]|uniref:dienelactone hydrolase family protein n=1 Tax=Rhodococcus sp. NPDC059234 TaxID=3346781 RepID=UPI00366F6E81
MPAITLDAPDGPLGAVLESPSGSGPFPGVVVVHDMLGLSVDIRNIARSIADHGYLALAPDLYSRGGRVRCVPRVFRELIGRRGRAVEDLLAARERLVADERCTGTVAVVGFCMGGGFALVMAPKGFDVSAPFYGVLPRQLDEALGGACPIVASFGTRDPFLRGAGAKLSGALDRLDVPHDVKTYSGVGHSFANHLPAPEPLLRITGFAYGPEQSEDAWRRVFAFLETHLHAPGAEGSP